MSTKFSALFLIWMSLNIPAAKAGDLGFVLCGSECGDTKFYVGYNRTNLATTNLKTASLPKQNDKIYHHVSDLTKNELLPSINEQKIDLENGNYVASLHRLDGVRIGFMKKSELMNVTSKSAAEAGASAHMVWGDTLKISSGTLRRGTPVNIQIQRNIGGFGAPVTDFAHYKLKSQTFVNGIFIPALDYTLEKKPGIGQTDKKVGQDKSTVSIMAAVGDTIKLESLFTVEDGVVASSTPQILNGADSVEYKVDVLTNGVELRSESGTFTNSIAKSGYEIDKVAVGRGK